MSKCPKCKAEIDHLIDYSKAEQKFEFTIDERGNPDYNLLDTQSLDQEDNFECPECNATLFHTEKEAKEFLAKA